MRKVIMYSALLVLGLVVAQFLEGRGSAWINPLTMFCLSFIMIHVGLEFEIDKRQPGKYLWDYVVAGTAAAFPWVFVAAYLVFFMAPAALWSHPDLWKETLLEARFASPTSAGVLFSMLAAAGLTATWMFRKARVLAIFDDLDTILLMIPLKIMMVGLRWQLMAVVVVIVVLLWMAWRYLNALRWPTSWPYILAYAAGITLVCEWVYLTSKAMDDTVPVHLEVLLPAFVLGCLLRPSHGQAPSRAEGRVATIVSCCFMVVVGLSMPAMTGPGASESSASAILIYEGAPAEALAEKNQFPGWGMMAVHVLAVTVLSNIGKMFPLLCYRREATCKERLALSIGMFPRGEVGAGVLVVSLSYGLGGPALMVAVLSLTLNLLGTGLFIIVVKKLLFSGNPSLLSR